MSSRGIFMALLLSDRVLVLPPPTRDNTTELAAALGTSSLVTMRARWGGGGDSHKSEQSLLSFARFDLSRHLFHIYDNREDSMEGLKALLLAEV